MKSFLTFYEDKTKPPTGDLKTACWKGYTAVGTKKKNGRTVPNCVPVSEAEDYIFGNSQKPTAYSDVNPSVGSTTSKKLYNTDQANPGVRPKNKKPLNKVVQSPKITNSPNQQEMPRTHNDLDRKHPMLAKKPVVEEVVMYKGKKLTVGKHDKTPDSKFDAEELALGIKTEKEHTGDARTAKSIAKDHLSEVPDYYSKLKKVEKNPTKTNEELISERGADSKGYKRPTEQGAGLTAKGAKHFGVQTAVTGKVKAGSKAAKRRKSFCARMSGMKGPMKDDKGRPTRKAMSLRRWRCR